MFIRIVHKDGGEAWVNTDHIVTLRPVQATNVGYKTIIELSDGTKILARDSIHDLIDTESGS